MKDLIDIIASADKHLTELRENAGDPAGSKFLKISEDLKGEFDIIGKSVRELLQENKNQQEEIVRLKKELRGEQCFDVKDNVYYTPDGDGPFCPNCYDRRKKLIRLRIVSPDESSTLQHACRLCGSSFTG